MSLLLYNRNLEEDYKMNTIKRIKGTSGNSLAEFAVVIALMATLMSTGQVKFSQAGEGGKGKKSGEEIDKIAKAANNFYNAMNQDEGAGRFPGQDKWDVPVPLTGGYDAATGVGSAKANLQTALTVLTGLDAYGNEAATPHKEWDSYQDLQTGGDYVGEGAKWCSVFGSQLEDFKAEWHELIASDDGFSAPSGYTADFEGQYIGPDEFALYMDPVKSPYLDGHFIYTVVAGDTEQSPTLIVTDLFEPSSEFTIVQP